MYDNRFPRLTVIAPGSMPDRNDVETGVKQLRASGHQVRLMPHIFTGDRLKHLAAPAADRAADLEAAWLSPETDAILCARGGGGSAQLGGGHRGVQVVLDEKQCFQARDCLAPGELPPFSLPGYKAKIQVHLQLIKIPDTFLIRELRCYLTSVS